MATAKQLNRFVLAGLVFLLAAQLTGLTCLSDFELVSLSAPSLTVQPPGHDTGFSDVTEDGCPCHLLFHAAPIVVFRTVAPFMLIPSDTATPLVSVSLDGLFHPPALV